jgi:hypothetical protein
MGDLFLPLLIVWGIQLVVGAALLRAANHFFVRAFGPPPGREPPSSQATIGPRILACPHCRHQVDCTGIVGQVACPVCRRHFHVPAVPTSGSSEVLRRLRREANEMEWGTALWCVFVQALAGGAIGLGGSLAVAQLGFHPVLGIMLIPVAQVMGYLSLAGMVCATMKVSFGRAAGIAAFHFLLSILLGIVLGILGVVFVVLYVLLRSA